jgi:hypothetical protein
MIPNRTVMNFTNLVTTVQKAFSAFKNYNSCHQIQGHRRTSHSSPRPYSTAVSHQYTIATFATLQVLSCIHSPRVHFRVAVLHNFVLTRHVICWWLLCLMWTGLISITALICKQKVSQQLFFSIQYITYSAVILKFPDTIHTFITIFAQENAMHQRTLISQTGIQVPCLKHIQVRCGSEVTLQQTRKKTKIYNAGTWD